MARGQHQKDAALFSAQAQPTLRRAAAELSWLLDRGYAEKSALVLVGDRHQLQARQRLAVGRAACADEDAAARRARRVELARMRGQTLALDGFNVLITTEVALSGGIVIVGRDGWTRDIASIHGSYRRVAQTPAAIDAIGTVLHAAGVAQVGWLLDRPVSNSGRLAKMLREHARDRGWPWEVELADDPDGVLARSTAIVATSDGWILDRAAQSCDLPAAAIAGREHVAMLDLREP